MGKSEFRVLIKHYFLRGNSIKETEEKLAKYYKKPAPLHGMGHSGSLNFVAAVLAQVMRASWPSKRGDFSRNDR